MYQANALDYKQSASKVELPTDYGQIDVLTWRNYRFPYQTFGTLKSEYGRTWFSVRSRNLCMTAQMPIYC